MAGEKQADEILMYWRLIVGGYTLHFLKANPDQLVIPVPACRCHRIARRRRSALVGRESSESESSRVSFRRTYVYLGTCTAQSIRRPPIRRSADAADAADAADPSAMPIRSSDPRPLHHHGESSVPPLP